MREATVDVDLYLVILESLVNRRQEMLSSVLLRQNPHNVSNWLKRAKLFKDDPGKVGETTGVVFHALSYTRTMIDILYSDDG